MLTRNVWIMQRIIVIAIPIFAFLDSVNFLRKSVIKAVQLKPTEAAHDLLQFTQSIKIFLLAVLTLPVSLVSPRLVYRSDSTWKDILKNQIAEMASNFQEDDSNFETPLKLTCAAIFPEKEQRELFEELTVKMASRLPKDSSLKKKAAEQNVSFFVSTLTEFSSRNVNFEQLSIDSLKDLIFDVHDIKRPSLRINLNKTAIKFIEKDPSLVEKWGELVKEGKAQH